MLYLGFFACSILSVVCQYVNEKNFAQNKKEKLSNYVVIATYLLAAVAFWCVLQFESLLFTLLCTVLFFIAFLLLTCLGKNLKINDFFEQRVFVEMFNVIVTLGSVLIFTILLTLLF
jgi:hypothetical protein